MQENMQNGVTRLLPQPVDSQPLAGLYLNHDIRARAEGRDRPFVYANFVASLDGRIAVPDLEQGGMKIPFTVANDRDWRLFQELAVQADVIITTGRYLRDYGEGKAQEILRVYDHPAFADLAAWRQARGLSPQPALVVVSSSLDFPIPEALIAQGRQVLVVTDERADPARVERLKLQLGQVLVAGDAGVRGGPFVDLLAAQGFHTIYSAAGPQILHMLLEDDVLDRLYLTTVPRLLGGIPYNTIVEGVLFDPPLDFALWSLYHDAQGPDGLGQLFACYERAR